MLTLTTNQLATLILRSENSRRRAKRYLRDHGGSGAAAELDAHLAVARANPEAVRLAEQRRAEAVRSAPQEPLATQAAIVASYAGRDWAALARLVPAEPTGMEAEETVVAHGRPTLEHFEAAMWPLVEPLPAAAPVGELADIVRGIALRAWDGAWLASALENLTARARPGARYVVCEYARDTLRPTGAEAAFESRGEAEAWLALRGDYSRSSLSAAIIDTQA